MPSGGEGATLAAMLHEILRRGDVDAVLLDLGAMSPGAVRWVRHLRASGARVSEVTDAGRAAVVPERSIVVADTPGAVAAAHAGGVAAVIGVAPNGGRAALLSAGAAVVVRDLGELLP